MTSGPRGDGMKKPQSLEFGGSAMSVRAILADAGVDDAGHGDAVRRQAHDPVLAQPRAADLRAIFLG